MSWKARTVSSCQAMRAGMWPATISQNRHGTAVECTRSALSARAHLGVQGSQELLDGPRVLAHVPAEHGTVRPHDDPRAPAHTLAVDRALAADGHLPAPPGLPLATSGTAAAAHELPAQCVDGGTDRLADLRLGGRVVTRLQLRVLGRATGLDGVQVRPAQHGPGA